MALIETSKLKLNPKQYRDMESEDTKYHIDDLAQNMKEIGPLSPIVVKENELTILDGECRWRAAMKLGGKTIEVVFKDVKEKDFWDRWLCC